MEQLEEAVALLREKYSHLTDRPGGPEWTPSAEHSGPLSRLKLSPLLCQPHEREPIEDHLKKMKVRVGLGR